MSIVAVFDIGKTNVKLSAASDDGRVLETLSTPNVVKDGPPYRHHDLDGLDDWSIDSLAALGRQHDIGAIVTCAHGSGGVLVDRQGAAMPMIDYEQPTPADVDACYRRIVGSHRERASAVMLGAAHLARQMLWQEMHWPEIFASALAYLATPQYWAFRLSGVLASEVTSLAAQSHLWASADGRPSALVANRGWQRLMPPMRRAWETLGPLRSDLAKRTGLKPTTRILCGLHDSSANFYRYQAADLSDVTVISTGTWIVALTNRTGVDFNVERPGHSCNADVFGNPMPGMLTMGGREFAAVAATAFGPASLPSLQQIVASGTFAVPTFGSDEGLFPGTAHRGRLEGPLAHDENARQRPDQEQGRERSPEPASARDEKRGHLVLCNAARWVLACGSVISSPRSKPHWGGAMHVSPVARCGRGGSGDQDDALSRGGRPAPRRLDLGQGHRQRVHGQGAGGDLGREVGQFGEDARGGHGSLAAAHDVQVPRAQQVRGQVDVLAGHGADLDPDQGLGPVGAGGQQRGHGQFGGSAPQVVDDDVDVCGRLAEHGGDVLVLAFQGHHFVGAEAFK